MKIGDKIFVIPIHSRQGDDTTPAEATITKIGTKYIEVDPSYYGRFHKDTLIHDAGKYSARYRAYASMQEYNRNIEQQAAAVKLYRLFSGYVGKPNLSLDQMNRIIAIIEEKAV